MCSSDLNYGVIETVGSGSPTGVTFGTKAKFPARYQDGMFISDWSYGNLWAVDIRPDGAGYQAAVSPFVSGRPFAVSGVIVNPADGSLLATTTGTEFYRVTYTGSESTAATTPDTRFAALREVRHNLEKFHGKNTAGAVAAVRDGAGFRAPVRVDSGRRFRRSVCPEVGARDARRESPRAAP